MPTSNDTHVPTKDVYVKLMDPAIPPDPSIPDNGEVSVFCSAASNPKISIPISMANNLTSADEENGGVLGNYLEAVWQKNKNPMLDVIVADSLNRFRIYATTKCTQKEAYEKSLGLGQNWYDSSKNQSTLERFKYLAIIRIRWWDEFRSPVPRGEIDFDSSPLLNVWIEKIVAAFNIEGSMLNVTMLPLIQSFAEKYYAESERSDGRPWDPQRPFNEVQQICWDASRNHLLEELAYMAANDKYHAQIYPMPSEEFENACIALRETFNLSIRFISARLLYPEQIKTPKPTVAPAIPFRHMEKFMPIFELLRENSATEMEEFNKICKQWIEAQVAAQLKQKKELLENQQAPRIPGAFFPSKTKAPEVPANGTQSNSPPHSQLHGK